MKKTTIKKSLFAISAVCKIKTRLGVYISNHENNHFSGFIHLKLVILKSIHIGKTYLNKVNPKQVIIYGVPTTKQCIPCIVTCHCGSSPIPDLIHRYWRKDRKCCLTPFHAPSKPLITIHHGSVNPKLCTASISHSIRQQFHADYEFKSKLQPPNCTCHIIQKQLTSFFSLPVSPIIAKNAMPLFKRKDPVCLLNLSGATV